MVVGLVLFLLGSISLWWSISELGGLWSVSLLSTVFRDISFEFVYSDLSITCLFMLICCGSMALFYCYHYFGGSASSDLLYPLMVWFLGVMGLLVGTSKFLSSLFFWEYLGLVSFFLMLFYSKTGSARASLITLFASRFGDVGLFFLMMVLGGWLEVSGFMFMLFLLLVVLTKSACYPFISWLLEAMRAPTPVSSLVHSSTLVAAGVWFFFSYSYVFGGAVLGVLFILSLVTILVSGVCALVFNDLKKLVALSTCNKVSWCVVFFICGDLDLALIQLLTHGVCKCYLFMVVGDLMSQSGGSQSSAGVYLTRYSGGWGVYLQSVLMLSLCGLPFLGVFFSKHFLFLEVLYVFGGGYILWLFLGVFLSYCYSFRFVLLLLKGLGGLSLGYVSNFVLISGLGVLGTVMNYLGVLGLSESGVLGLFSSFFLLFIQLGGCLFGWLFFVLGGISLVDGLGVACSGLGYSDSMIKGMYKNFLVWGEFSFFSFYRWEMYLFSLGSRLFNVYDFIRGSFFSFKMLVFSLVVFLLVGLFFF